MNAGLRAAPEPINGRQPRLIVLTPAFPPAHGGVEVLVHRLAIALNEFEVEVVTLAHPGDERFDSGSPLATRRVARHVPGQRARMLALNAAALRHALRFRPDVVLSAHLITSPAAAGIRRLAGTRTAQYFFAREIIGKPRLAAFAATRADVAIAISRYTASLVAAAAPLARPTVIPPGVDLPADRHPLPSGRPTVLTVAQLKNAYKGHDVLIRAVARVREHVPDVSWIVIGDGPLRRRLEEEARAAGLDGAAQFLGEVSDEQRDAWLRRADVFAMPSRLPGEGFGIAYLEASAYGKPVVAGDAGGAPDAVADGISGLLVDPNDPAAVAGALMKLIADPELAQRLGAQGAERARDFAWPVIAARVAAALHPAGTPHA
jgi:phosphatidylinositol alpha-1,6-mannosyltransferase